MEPAGIEWSVNPVLEASAKEKASDLWGSLLVLKHAETLDNAHVRAHMMSLNLP